MSRIKVILVIAAVIGGVAVSKGITLEEYLLKVEAQNPLLKSSALSAEAIGEELSAENRLEPLSVEYSPFFRKGAGGVANSELIIQQEFDFPTVFAARRKAARHRVMSAEKTGNLTRRDLLVAARGAYVNLVYALKVRDLCAERLEATRAMLSLVNKQKENGAVSELDVNRAGMEVMTAEASFLRSQGNVASAKSIMKSMLTENDSICEDVGYPILPVFKENDSELMDKLLKIDPELEQGRYELVAEEASVNVARQNLLPRLAVGYRRNTEEKESLNGFLVGASFPIYNGNAAVKSARRRCEAKALENESLMMRLEGEIAGKNAQCVHLQKALESYDMKLMKESIGLMMKGVEMRHISLPDYYVEMAGIYDKMEEYLELENALQLAATELMANTL